ncbi:DUF1631 family protein [Alkalimarinus alittae]|uniref:DUF1631 family protein n=1 Tax=Alkalimarinus alittae TaxID=2961619 RepID=A0ABY6N689_9ALTE|nr:DUF1631 family protein [Alkalimarinus alittae]UZE97504.1 DUF1631 family protein [Alkalimarinus alittae]
MQNTPFTAQQQQKKDITEKLLLSYRKLILENLPLAIERAIKEAEVKLMLSINESMDGVLRSDFSVSLQMLETRSHWLSEKVSKDAVIALIDKLKSQSSTPPKSVKKTQKTLSVVEKDDFEDWLAMNSAIRLIEEDLGYELNRICYIFEVISGRGVDVKSCPVGPSIIINAFQEGCSLLKIPSSSYPIIYKILGRILNSELKDIYGVLLSAAERYGISGTAQSEKEPSKKTAYQEREAAQDELKPSASSETNFLDNTPLMADEELFGAPTTQPQRETGQNSQNSPSSVSAQGDTYATLQRLINLKASVAVNSGGSTASSGQPEANVRDIRYAYYQSSDVIEAVNQLQSLQLKEDSLKEALEQSERTRNKGYSGNVVELPLRDVVKKQLIESGKEEAQLGKTDNELIEITDRLFETLLDQVGVSTVLKRWLKKLKLSVLKVVLLDHTFFSDNSHPARQVINQLAKLAGTKRTPNRSIERSLEYFTNRIIKEYTGDLRLFEELLIEISHLVSRQEEAFKRNAERVARAYEGQQRLTEARETIVSEIDRRIKGKKIPKILLSLLDEGGWRQLMLVTLLREGEDSKRFKESLAVLDQLLAWLGESSEGEESVGDSFEKDLEAPTFLTMIDRELKATGQATHSNIIEELKEYLVQGKKVPLCPAEPYRWSVETDQEQIVADSSRSQTEDNKPGNSRWHKRARMMVIGDWVEIIDEENVAQRMRLAWSGSKSFRFVFVDSQGMKDIDISLDELAERMNSGKATLLDKEEVPVIDQGLHQMVQSVYEDLSNQASCDPLTGLLNRQSFERNLERTVADSMANQTAYVVCFLDIDQFKVVNNTYGHIAGDQLLKHVASVVRQSAGPMAICGRVGGNEFGVIFDHCALKEGTVLCENIRTAVSDSTFLWQENALIVTISAGLTEIDAASDSSDTVMKKASVACNFSKEHGRNRVTAYTPQDRDQAHHDEMMTWIQKIDHSLEDLLMLRCQEIRPVNKAEGRFSHYEILLGVYDEDKNILPPVALIEAAEHFGRMTRVDKWVIHNTLRWMENNPIIVENVDGFSINLSGTSINEEHFLDFVLSELSATSVPRHKICFEITETAAITNLSDATDFIKVLRKTGCKFSLDDFGTGLSSYAYIQKLPMDYIKIDGVFIKNIVNNKKDQALVKSINELAHFMGMETIAEFVENSEILSMLKLIGVDHAQGYGIARPAPLSDAFSSIRA